MEPVKAKGSAQTGLKTEKEPNDSKTQALVKELEDALNSQRELETQLKAKEQELRALRQSRSFRFGAAIFQNVTTPSRWHKIPVDMAKALLTKAPQAKNSSTTTHNPNQVSQAYQYAAKTGDWASGFKKLSKSNESDQRQVANLFHAAANHDDDRTWTDGVNAYLQGFGLAPVSLIPGSRPLFHRLASGDLPGIEDSRKISVIMPAYNGAETLKLAVRSITNQTWRNLELIVMDDCSTDETGDLLKTLAIEDPRIRVFRNSENIGPYISKNIAVSKADGDFITGHDADDWAHPERLANQIASLETAASRKGCISHMLRMNENGIFEQFVKVGNISFDGAARIASISAMFEKQFFLESLGAWDGAKFGADSELIHRVETHFPNAVTRQCSISMFCLSSAGNLTNNSAHGILSNNGRMSPTRASYKEAWLQWHDSLSPGQTCLPFPHEDRKFSMPNEMVVDMDKIKRVIKHHDKA